MDKFEVGEITVTVVSHHGKEGEECEILTGLTFRESRKNFAHCISLWAHRVRYSDGEELWVSAEALRKRRPPTEISTWEEVEAAMEWNPTKQKCNES